MRICIAMATYNGSRHVEEQLRSFEAQSVQPAEVVIVDDASTDDTVEVVTAFARQSKLNVRLVSRLENRGVLSTFNEAMQLAEGDVIMFSDQDDAWFPDKLQTVQDVFAQTRSAMVVINDQIIADENLNPSGRTKLGNIRQSGHDDAEFFTGCCTSFRREWRDFLGDIPPNVPHHDGWINYPAHLLGCRVILERPLQLYRRHGKTVTTWEMSRPERPSIGYRVKKMGMHFSDPRPAMRSRLQLGEELASRFETTEAPECVSSRIGDALQYLRSGNGAIRSRIAILEKNRIARYAGIAKLARSGGYGFFSGRSSLLKDIVSPRLK